MPTPASRIASLIDDLERAAKHRDWRTIHTIAAILLESGKHGEIRAIAEQYPDIRPLLERLMQRESEEATIRKDPHQL